MSREAAVASHYTHGDLLTAIKTSLADVGKSLDELTIHDLAALDEFHIGGRAATENLLNQLDIEITDHLLDIGCGIGGAARYAAQSFAGRVTGVDLTEEYINTGNEICSWVSLQDRVTLACESALALPYKEQSFDAGYMMHVGMNIEDKACLFSEIYRVLKPGSKFGVYDVMLVGNDEPTFPMPWANTPDTSSLSSPAEYHRLLLQAGFDILATDNRREFALSFFDEMRARMAALEGQPHLGLHTLIGGDMAEKFRNLIAAVTAGVLAPVEVIVIK
ncbi:class I SAM-dependent methyltransferase [Hahella ganghwensis]|uniref:class I SAM-dependent methyltransferase n=1 Tax=Hahella ganghwensis TaxID=286420 RepID=UPI00037D0019|nr:class I SAM-dependent methyltransferase [Hahella ganghwensis]